MAGAGIFKSEKVRAQFETAYDVCIGAADAGETKVVQNFDIMMAALKCSDLVEEMQLPVHRVGVHPANRNGKAMSGRTMQAKGAKIVSVGVSPKLCLPDRCVCFEVTGPEVRDRMLHTVKHSDMFGKVSDNVNFGSVGCSHLNQFLHAVRDGAVTAEANLKSPDSSVIDTDRLYKQDAHLKSLCQHGLTWSVVNCKVTDHYPELPHLFQMSLNVEHHISEGETWDQAIMGLSKLATQHAKTTAQGTVIDWKKVEKLIRQSAPPFIRDVPGYITYLKKYGGGKDQVFAKELVEY